MTTHLNAYNPARELCEYRLVDTTSTEARLRQDRAGEAEDCARGADARGTGETRADEPHESAHKEDDEGPPRIEIVL